MRFLFLLALAVGLTACGASVPAALPAAPSVPMHCQDGNPVHHVTCSSQPARRMHCQDGNPIHRLVCSSQRDGAFIEVIGSKVIAVTREP